MKTLRRALVCGASQGIGLACAQALAVQGHQVILLARDPARLESARNELANAQNQHLGLACDLTDHDAVRRVIAAELAQGDITVLVNNTAGPPPGPVMLATDSQFLACFHQHLLSNHLITNLLLPGMKRQQFGRVVNVISTSVKEPLKDLGVSNTIRGAVASWAKTLAGEVASDGITVNNVLPGYTQTQRLSAIIASRMQKTGLGEQDVVRAMLADVPAGRAAQPAEIAAAVAFLCSESASYITGVNLPVDGGRTRSL